MGDYSRYEIIIENIHRIRAVYHAFFFVRSRPTFFNFKMKPLKRMFVTLCPLQASLINYLVGWKKLNSISGSN